MKLLNNKIKTENNNTITIPDVSDTVVLINKEQTLYSRTNQGNTNIYNQRAENISYLFN